MGRLFDLDSPIMNFLSKLADVIWLNVLTVVCSIPVFTVGASMTALHYVMLKIVRNEESYITRSFFKSFKQNFKQATIIWLILLLGIVILVGDLLILKYSGMAFPDWLQTVLLAATIFFLFAVMHVFPVLSKFENSVINTYKNSLFMGILSLPKTIIMMFCWAIPAVVVIYLPQAFPLVLGLGISGPAFLCALLYNKTFKRFEPEEESCEGWTVEKQEKEGGTEKGIEFDQ